MTEGLREPRSRWPVWPVLVACVIAVLVTLVLGTFGWLVAGLAIGTDCTNKFTCGSGWCSPCAVSHAWVIAGGLGQWILVAAAITLLVVGLSRATSRRAAVLAGSAIIPLAIAWFAATWTLAAHSY